jgi:ferritin-like metal-binding protein YciE
MAQRLAGCFDLAVSAALDALEPDDLRAQLVSYLTDAHAIEAQSLKLLEKGTKIAGVPALATVYEQHHIESLEHQRLLEAALERREVGPSKLKDAAMHLGALNWGMFFQAQPDTPAKLAAFSYAFENLEIASYEMLERAARRAGEDDVRTLAAHILGEERAAAGKVWRLLADALSASLHDQGVLSR